MYKCPHCEAKIECLDYRIYGYEYGSYDPASEDYNHQETEFDGDTNYFCPECGDDIADPNELEEINDEEETTEQPTQTPTNPLDTIAPIIAPRQVDNPMIVDKDNYRLTSDNFARCPHCQTGVEFRDNETTMDCPNCNQAILETDNRNLF